MFWMLHLNAFFESVCTKSELNFVHPPLKPAIILLTSVSSDTQINTIIKARNTLMAGGGKPGKTNELISVSWKRRKKISSCMFITEKLGKTNQALHVIFISQLLHGFVFQNNLSQ